MAKPASEIVLVKRWAQNLLRGQLEIELLAGDRGGRSYYRLKGLGLVVLSGTDQAENLAWLRIGRHLWFKGLPLPRIVYYDLPGGLFLLEDLGDQALTGLAAEDLYFQAVELAARIHTKGLEGFDTRWRQQTVRYSVVMAEKSEISYFFDQFILGCLRWPGLPKGVKREAKFLASTASGFKTGEVLMRCDYQGRNLFYYNGQLNVLDWQGARLGPAVYDLSGLME